MVYRLLYYSDCNCTLCIYRSICTSYRNNNFALPSPALHLMLIYYDCKLFPGVPENMITAVLYLVGQVGKCLTLQLVMLSIPHFRWRFRIIPQLTQKGNVIKSFTHMNTEQPCLFLAHQLIENQAYDENLVKLWK